MPGHNLKASVPVQPCSTDFVFLPRCCERYASSGELLRAVIEAKEPENKKFLKFSEEKRRDTVMPCAGTVEKIFIK
jgi:hypothetical protein